MKLLIYHFFLLTVPKPVTGLAVTELQTTSITFSWQKDQSCTYCAYDHFLATHTPDSPPIPSIILALTYEDYYVTSFGELTPGKLYTFEVKSERNGKLSSSAALEQRTGMGSGSCHFCEVDYKYY